MRSKSWKALVGNCTVYCGRSDAHIMMVSLAKVTLWFKTISCQTTAVFPIFFNALCSA